MLITSIADFVKYIPTAEGTEFKAIEPFLGEAENQLISLFLGEDLYQYLELITSPDTTAEPPVEAGADYKLKQTATRLLCLQAYENAIPFVDLIQTNNGFAVVQNSNQAPASKERVQKLIDWVKAQIYINADLLIQMIMKTPAALVEWTKCDQFNNLTNCLFLTGQNLSEYMKVEGIKRLFFIEIKNQLVAWQSNILEKVISADYMSQLVEETRANTFTTGAVNVINYCKMILGQLAAGKRDEAEKLCHTLSNILDANLETYTVYAASDEYALRNTAPYENLLEDPTFFFGV